MGGHCVMGCRAMWPCSGISSVLGRQSREEKEPGLLQGKNTGDRPQYSGREAYGKMMRCGTPVHLAAGNQDRTTKASSRLVWAML